MQIETTLIFYNNIKGITVEKNNNIKGFWVLCS